MSDLSNEFIDNIITGDNVKAREVFDNMMAVKITSALDTKKKELSQTIFNQTNQEEEQNEEV